MLNLMKCGLLSTRMWRRSRTIWTRNFLHMGIYLKKKTSFQSHLRGRGFWEHDIEASKMRGCARGRKGERKTYHINPYHHITMEFGGNLLNVAKKTHARKTAQGRSARGPILPKSNMNFRQPPYLFLSSCLIVFELMVGCFLHFWHFFAVYPGQTATTFSLATTWIEAVEWCQDLWSIYATDPIERFPAMKIRGKQSLETIVLLFSYKAFHLSDGVWGSKMWHEPDL